MARSARIKIPSDLQTRAAFEASTFDAEKRTVEVTWTTGARGKRLGWDGPFYEELEVSEAAVDLSRLNNAAPLLAAHNQYSLDGVIGVVERAWLSGSEGRALVRFSDREDVKPIVADVKSGILRHVSVGYSIQKMEKVEEVDGVPVYRVTRWTPGEISLVPMGFDDRATVRGREQQDFCEVEITTQERNMDQPETPVAPVAPAAPVVNPTDATRAADAARASDEAVRAAAEKAAVAERERGVAIRSLVTRAKLDVAFADEMIAKGVTVDAARAAILDKLATRDEQTRTEQHTTFEAGEDADSKFARGAVASILARSGADHIVREASKTDLGAPLANVAADPGEMRGWKLETIARECLERRGIKTRGMSPEKLFGEALTHRSANTTSDFPILLESAMGKVLLAAFATQPDTWRAFCAKRSVPDFRSATFYRNGSFGVLDAVNEAGEFKNKSIPDGEKASISVGTKGNIIAITRKALVNDDLGAFMDLATRFGRAAAMSIESDVYALLALNSGLGPAQSDSQPLFHSNRKNVGTAAVISVDAIDADASLMASQKDPSGHEYLDLQPAVLVVPRGLKGTALVINQSQFEPTANKLQVPNRCNGMFREVVGTARLTGTRRYLFADPAIAPVIAVAFIDGKEAPEMFTEDGWRVDGTEMKVRIDYGVAAVDYRGGVTNAGTP